MDGELIYALVGIVIFSVVAFKIMRSDISAVINTKEDTKDTIIRRYRQQLYKALAALENDKEARMAKKSELLKKFSDELSRNIFFENIEIKEIILDLAESY